jgi:hypothetical protein
LNLVDVTLYQQELSGTGFPALLLDRVIAAGREWLGRAGPMVERPQSARRALQAAFCPVMPEFHIETFRAGS